MGYDEIAAAEPTRLDVKGYITIRLKGHERAAANGRVREHIAVAQAALGKPLPVGAVVHHVNGIKSDNRRCNLVICQDETYHKYLHRRMRVLAAGGDPNTQRRCSTCKQLVLMTAMAKTKRNGKPELAQECKACSAARAKRWMEVRRGV